jgi:peptidoglycan/LPS O-acetylase OafA/YrhL
MHTFNSAFVPKGQLLTGIHGLRGIAALAVVLYHLVHIGDIKPSQFFEFVGRDFGYSVHLFFIISAYSLMHSTEPKINRPNWLSDYFIKRFFRIAPLFYSMIVFFLLVVGYQSITNIVLNLTFTFGFIPSSGFIWGGWSVGVEMIFYAIFPVFILLIRTHRAALIFLILSIIITCALRSALHYQYVGIDSSAGFDWSYFSFASNICFFAMGMYAYLLGKTYSNDTKLISVYVPIIAVSTICGLLFSNLGATLYGSSRLDIVLWGLGLTALTIWQGVKPCVLVANRFFEYLGERSFSIYLLHPVVIFYSKTHLAGTYSLLHPYTHFGAYFATSILLITLLLVLAEFTYRFIEVPGIEFGRKLINKRKFA